MSCCGNGSPRMFRLSVVLTDPVLCHVGVGKLSCTISVSYRAWNCKDMSSGEKPKFEMYGVRKKLV